MTIANLPQHIQAFVSDLLDKGVEVWLIGSRINMTGKPPADWDLLVFGDNTLLRELSEAPLAWAVRMPSSLTRTLGSSLGQRSATSLGFTFRHPLGRADSNAAV